MSKSFSQPAQRIGPRPLGLHLGLATLTFGSSIGALPLVREGKYPWLPELKAEAAEVTESLKSFELTDLSAALAMEGNKRILDMMSGIQKYHVHPYRRQQRDHDVIWSLGEIQLLDCSKGLPDNAPVIFLIPSLVNRSYILDLMPDRSFVDALSQAGIRPLLVAWNAPGERESSYTMDDYVSSVLVPAIDFTAARFPEVPLHVCGYCMGGTLATAVVQFSQHKLSSFIAIATPWDFHADLGPAAKAFLKNEEGWSLVLDSLNELPVDIIQAFFASLDPNLCMNKFSMFNHFDQDSARATTFVALEDWLNDGAPLVRKVAKTCFNDWYGENKTVAGSWYVHGKAICPEMITIPSMIAIPNSDKIVPPESAKALGRQIPNATIVSSGSGHIGMMVGGGAPAGLWQNVIDWIRNL